MRPKGSPKTPGSGRKSGSLNKRTVELMEKLEALRCDPAVGLVRLAQRAKRNGDVETERFCLATLMPYLYPKKSAVEVSADGAGLADQLMAGIVAARSRM